MSVLLEGRREGSMKEQSMESGVTWAISPASCPNCKARDYPGASAKQQKWGKEFWRFFCFQKIHFPLLNDPYNNLNYFSYSVEIVSMAKLNCAIPLIYKTCFSLCLVPLETWVVSACLNFTLPPSTSIQTWLLSKVTSMHWCFTYLNWAF